MENRRNRGGAESAGQKYGERNGQGKQSVVPEGAGLNAVPVKMAVFELALRMKIHSVKGKSWNYGAK